MMLIITRYFLMPVWHKLVLILFIQLILINCLSSNTVSCTEFDDINRTISGLRTREYELEQQLAELRVLKNTTINESVGAHYHPQHFNEGRKLLQFRSGLNMAETFYPSFSADEINDFANSTDWSWIHSINHKMTTIDVELRGVKNNIIHNENMRMSLLQDAIINVTANVSNNIQEDYQRLETIIQNASTTVNDHHQNQTNLLNTINSNLTNRFASLTDFFSQRFSTVPDEIKEEVVPLLSQQTEISNKLNTVTNNVAEAKTSIVSSIDALNTKFNTIENDLRSKVNTLSDEKQTLTTELAEAKSTIKAKDMVISNLQDVINGSRHLAEAKQQVNNIITNQPTYNIVHGDYAEGDFHKGDRYEAKDGGFINTDSPHSTIAPNSKGSVAGGSGNTIRQQTIGPRTVECFTKTCQSMSNCCGDITVNIRQCLGL